ncbi:DUF4604 domain-containing protein [Aphelenchoides bicaudatus]|nr:DUF4604 domain-containing protein [Aphelenchoides bicaudatus]
MPRNSRGGGSGKPDKKLTYKQKSNITFVDEADPPFLRAMKEKMGYQEPTVEDKFHEDVSDDEEDPDDIRNMKEAEKPVIVVLDEKKDLSVEQVDEETRKKREEDDRLKIEQGKITFKKPTKRPNEETAEKDGDASNKKQPKNEPQKANKSMLSFGGDEEDE